MPRSSPSRRPAVRARFAPLAASACLLLACSASSIRAQDTGVPSSSPASGSPSVASPEPRLFIREFRVQGATVVPAADIQRAVTPFLGPGRTFADVESARQSLEKLYRERGYQVASVEVPPQRAKRGLVILRVHEGEIGRVRVVGSRYHDIEQIRADVPSLAEGSVPEFNAISRDVAALNRMPDRRVVPDIRPGVEPGVIDVDLKVEDELPFHASAELNDRYSADTSRLRLNLSASYDNLWQLGHSVGASVQTSPLEWNEVLVYTGSYTARLASLPEWTFMASATRQDTDISTLGGAAVAGKGDIYGLRATRVLPGTDSFFHSFSFGLDRKDYDQAVVTAGVTTTTPILYYPLALTYSGFIDGEAAQTEFFTGATLHFRGMGSGTDEFDVNRYGAEANFATLRGDISHTRHLPAQFSTVVRVQGQLASGPLISNEQFAAGGIDTVRGYLEGEALGDNALVGSLEFVSPSLIPSRDRDDRLNALVFAEGALLSLYDTPAGQDDAYDLASVGFGFRFHLFRHFDGSSYLAFPLVDQGETEKGDARVTFMIRGSL